MAIHEMRPARGDTVTVDINWALLDEAGLGPSRVVSAHIVPSGVSRDSHQRFVPRRAFHFLQMKAGSTLHLARELRREQNRKAEYKEPKLRTIQTDK